MSGKADARVLTQLERMGYTSVQSKMKASKKSKRDEGHEEDDDEEEDEEDHAEEKGARDADGTPMSKRERRRMKAEMQKHLDEYYKLDYEDTVAGMPTRFHYASVLPKKYGMKAGDILKLSDKELNQVVSLKKIAPYKEDMPEPKWKKAAGAWEKQLADTQKKEARIKAARKKNSKAAKEDDLAKSRLSSYEMDTKSKAIKKDKAGRRKKEQKEKKKG
ncbi:hypothetical protein CYMTET_52570 [Cymbomonas tetramitiformis]|uniref:Kri1-like C-terminal domain-containing protein n=1 Tax=Cymbomonas tetramitiformis TaxID=36881 RepID=A0AAE0BJ07_9CHLO|nr:hypothetical protein CYMTET_52570 [Cymbomonas tetramitiformis]